MTNRTLVEKLFTIGLFHPRQNRYSSWQNKLIYWWWILLSCPLGLNSTKIFGITVYFLCWHRALHNITTGQQSHFIAKTWQLAQDSGIPWPYHIRYHTAASGILCKGSHVEIKRHFQRCRIHTKSTTFLQFFSPAGKHISLGIKKRNRSSAACRDSRWQSLGVYASQTHKAGLGRFRDPSSQGDMISGRDRENILINFLS